jgi:hypothetical protein
LLDLRGEEGVGVHAPQGEMHGLKRWCQRCGETLQWTHHEYETVGGCDVL